MRRRSVVVEAGADWFEVLQRRQTSGGVRGEVPSGTAVRRWRGSQGEHPSGGGQRAARVNRGRRQWRLATGGTGGKVSTGEGWPSAAERITASGRQGWTGAWSTGVDRAPDGPRRRRGRGIREQERSEGTAPPSTALVLGSGRRRGSGGLEGISAERGSGRLRDGEREIEGLRDGEIERGGGSPPSTVSGSGRRRARGRARRDLDGDRGTAGEQETE